VPCNDLGRYLAGIAYRNRVGKYIIAAVRFRLVFKILGPDRDREFIGCHKIPHADWWRCMKRPEAQNLGMRAKVE
jgi:hypothetical protein